MLRSTDGGKSFNLVPATHGDHHALWIDPNDPRVLANTNDGGGSISLDGGATWSTQMNQPTAAIYHVATDMRFPYWVYGAQQDNSNLTVASFDDEGVIGARDWYPAGGGESGFVVPDPRDAEIIYSDAENQFGRYDRHAEQVRDISPWGVDNSGHPAAELLHRFNWTSPLMLSPHDPDTIYAASEVVWKSTDHGNELDHHQPGPHPQRQVQAAGQRRPAHQGHHQRRILRHHFRLAESPLAKGKLWAGSDDGLVHVSDDGGSSLDGLPRPKTCPRGDRSTRSIHRRTMTPGEPTVAVDRHKLDDVAPYAWKTSDDDGRTWTSIAAGLPNGAPSSMLCEKILIRAGLLYTQAPNSASSSRSTTAVLGSVSAAALPAAAVHDITVKGDDLVAATHGRAFWILTDLTPLASEHRPHIGVP